MPKSKRYTIEELAEQTAKKLFSERSEWISFLQTCSKLYKYSFADQLLIYAQRPDATACASFDTWVSQARYVRRGSKGIALLDDTSSFPKLKYVYAYNDTGGNDYPFNKFLWNLNLEHENIVSKTLESHFAVELTNISNQFEQITAKLVNEFWNDNKHDFLYMIDDSLLSDYDELNVEVQFKTAAMESTRYILALRCGFEPEFEEVASISNFNTLATLSYLGTAISGISEQILREIERTVKYERERETHGQTKLQEERRVSNTRFNSEERNSPIGQVRKNEEDLYSGVQEGIVRIPDFERTISGISGNNRFDSGGQNRSNNGESNEVAKHNRRIKRGESTRLGGSHEQLQSASGGNGSLRTGLYVKPPNGQNENSTIDEAKDTKEFFASFLSQEIIDVILRQGGKDPESRLRLCTHFKRGKSVEKIADFMSNEYMDAKGFIIDDEKIAVVFKSSGIYANKGISAHDNAFVLQWQEAAERVEELLENGEFLDRFALGQVDGNEIKDIAQSYWYLCQEAEDPSQLGDMFQGSFPRDTAKFKTVLQNSVARAEIIQILQNFAKIYEEDPKVLRFHYYKPLDLLSRIQALDMNINQYSSHLTEIPKFKEFITDDDITEELLNGGNVSGGRDRIYDYFKEDHSAKEKSDFLKNEYGWGGRSNSQREIQYDGKGLTLGKRDCEKVRLSWLQVTNRIDELVSTGKYKENTKPKLDTAETISKENDEINPDNENYKISDTEQKEFSSEQRYLVNIAAINTLKLIEADGRKATEEEKEVLSKYVGWGGLSQYFNFKEERAEELKNILTEDEYTSARESTLSSYYTSPTVINAIYQTLDKLGFKQGRILEPSLGVGNFFGMLPTNMAGSSLDGIEIDSISGRIARQLYPQANINITGFETTDKHDYYDVVVGNVPFGQFKLRDSDKELDKLGFNIHDYFFAKAIEQVRPGGIIALVTSRYTMDKKGSDVRRYIAQRAELLGAIRLPNSAFKANAGTEVTSDILFLQKRDRPIDIAPEWLYLAESVNDIPINDYFVENPHMVLGEMVMKQGKYLEAVCQPHEGVSLKEQLKEAVNHISGHYIEADYVELKENSINDEIIPADPRVKNFSYCNINGEVYYRENENMVRQELNQMKKARIIGMIGLRDCVRTLLEQQLDETVSEKEIKATQSRLNQLYDNFSAKHGLISSKVNRGAFCSDDSYYLLCSLEIIDKNGDLKSKSDIFNKRTITPAKAVTRVDTASEALVLSISEKACVDMQYMSQLTNLTTEQITKDLNGVIFRLPETKGESQFVTADEYLSGNVREKLQEAKLAATLDSNFNINVSALEKAQPKDLEAAEITVKLGSTWVDKKYINQFMYETLQTSTWKQRQIQVDFSEITSTWNISNKNNVDYDEILPKTVYGTKRINAYEIIEDTLNLRDVRIYDYKTVDGKEKRILNQTETDLAQEKQQLLKDAFSEWIWKDPERRQHLAKEYNQRFNSIRLREFDGKHIVFHGMNKEITLRPHQLNAIARILYGGNTLLAHAVGAGKTFEIVAGAMESKHLGLCTKSMIAVPNHLTQQWAVEFLQLYPNANILVATKKDFEKQNRKKFVSRIATGNYDAVIIAHSQFEKIPLSLEKETEFINKEIEEIQDSLASMKAEGVAQFSIKQAELTKKNLEYRLDKLVNRPKKDDVINFESLGIDRLFVDESHNYKNLYTHTKMRNVAGISTAEAQKSTDMYLKCKYINELTNYKGIVFATGTPISNSMIELFSIQRYLQAYILKKLGLTHFDRWASTFGETSVVMELAPEGVGYRPRTRFSKFYNVPELMQIFKLVADIKMADDLDLDRPEAVYHTEVAEPSEHQKVMIQQLSDRAKAIHDRQVNPSQDNMLKITSDGRKLGLDQRLINPLLPDSPESKINLCTQKIVKIWKYTESKRLTQLVFCDTSTPKKDQFNIYDDIKKKLKDQGIPEGEIAFIHDANNDIKKAALFMKVRQGEVRVLLGSTAKMGAGTNVQDKIVASHDVDCPWRASDLEQRGGRSIRQGNENETVHIYRYVTEGTFDAYLWQTVENKQKITNQIMTSRGMVRSFEDVDETALSFAQIKALAVGDPLIKEKMDLDIAVTKLKLVRANYQNNQFKLEDDILFHFPEKIAKYEGNVKGYLADLEILETYTEANDFSIILNDQVINDRETAGKEIIELCKKVQANTELNLGMYKGFNMGLFFNAQEQSFYLRLKGTMSYLVKLTKNLEGNLNSMDFELASISGKIENCKNGIDNCRKQIDIAQKELGKPFPSEEEYQRKEARLKEVTKLLDISKLENTEVKKSVLPYLKIPSQNGSSKIYKCIEEVR